MDFIISAIISNSIQLEWIQFILISSPIEMDYLSSMTLFLFIRLHFQNEIDLIIFAIISNSIELIDFNFIANWNGLFEISLKLIWISNPFSCIEFRLWIFIAARCRFYFNCNDFHYIEFTVLCIYFYDI